MTNTLEDIIKYENKHAYLIEINNDDDYKYIYNYVKKIVCRKSYKDNCQDCNICYRIDHNEYPEVIFIDNIANIVKKDDILAIKRSFSNCSLEGQARVYIINNIENLSLSASNTLLKFLEEPEGDNIVAILVTKNCFKVLPTIKSRCQIVKASINNERKINDFMILDEKNDKLYIQSIKKIAFDLIWVYNNKKTKIITDLKKIINSQITGKKDYINLLNVMILCYKDIINCNINQPLVYFNDWIDKINILGNDNDNISIAKKITKILRFIKYLEGNANQTLTMDKLFIDLED